MTAKTRRAPTPAERRLRRLMAAFWRMPLKEVSVSETASDDEDDPKTYAMVYGNWGNVHRTSEKQPYARGVEDLVAQAEKALLKRWGEDMAAVLNLGLIDRHAVRAIYENLTEYERRKASDVRTVKKRKRPARRPRVRTLGDTF